MRRGRAGPELLRCSFVYTDGFQMLASDRSATERWGAAQQFGACASRPGLRPGWLKKTRLRFVITLQLFPKAESLRGGGLKYEESVTNIVLVYWGDTCEAQ